AEVEDALRRGGLAGVHVCDDADVTKVVEHRGRGRGGRPRRGSCNEEKGSETGPTVRSHIGSNRSAGKPAHPPHPRGYRGVVRTIPEVAPGRFSFRPIRRRGRAAGAVPGGTQGRLGGDNSRGRGVVIRRLLYGWGCGNVQRNGENRVKMRVLFR